MQRRRSNRIRKNVIRVTKRSSRVTLPQPHLKTYSSKYSIRVYSTLSLPPSSFSFLPSPSICFALFFFFSPVLVLKPSLGTRKRTTQCGAVRCKYTHTHIRHMCVRVCPPRRVRPRCIRLFEIRNQTDLQTHTHTDISIITITIIYE